MSRCTAQRSDLVRLAGYGYCASHTRWYWGLKLYLLTTAESMPVAWCLANPKLDEREVAIELLAHTRDNAALRPGMVVLTDKGVLHPGRATPARPGRGDLAQLADQRRDQAFLDRLRPLINTESIV
jgi:hypothetical protein